MLVEGRLCVVHKDKNVSPEEKASTLKRLMEDPSVPQHFKDAHQEGGVIALSQEEFDALLEFGQSIVEELRKAYEEKDYRILLKSVLLEVIARSELLEHVAETEEDIKEYGSTLQ